MLGFFLSLAQTRNGNGSGSGQVFPYPDQTRGPRPVARLLNRFFSQAQTRPRRAPRATWAPLGRGTSGPIMWPNKKKNVCIILIFSATKQDGKKNTQENPLFSQQPTDLNNQKPTKPQFSATNRLETPFFSLQYFPTSKVKTRINIQTLGLNNKTLQNQIKQADLFNQNNTKTRNYKFDSSNKKNDFHCKSLSSQRGEGDERVAAL